MRIRSILYAVKMCFKRLPSLYSYYKGFYIFNKNTDKALNELGKKDFIRY